MDYTYCSYNISSKAERDSENNLFRAVVTITPQGSLGQCLPYNRAKDTSKQPERPKFMVWVGHEDELTGTKNT